MLPVRVTVSIYTGTGVCHILGQEGCDSHADYLATGQVPAIIYRKGVPAMQATLHLDKMTATIYRDKGGPVLQVILQLNRVTATIYRNREGDPCSCPATSQTVK